MAALDTLSLHQLRVLLTLLEERSVSGAARRLGVSQPAVSHALRGLRDALDDAILVPGGRGMVPTPRALALVGPLRRALRELELLLGSGAAFDPATARRTFVIASWDGLALALLPRLLDSFRDHAPCVDLDVLPVPAGGSAAALEDGSLDLSIEVRPRAAPGLKQRALREDDFVCLLRADHPCLAATEGGTLDLDTYLRLPHALLSPQGEGEGVVDRLLAAQGLRRRVALRIRYFLAAPLIVARSDLVLTAPRSLAEALAGLVPLRVLRPPIDVPPFTTCMVWHERGDHDPAQRWLRAQVLAACGAPAGDGGA